MGGEIARSNFIKSSNICTLNFHSGLSPFFNGNNSLLNTYRKKNLSYIGGTLMIMSPKIDHGNILSHYLTPISLKDKRYDLYMKTIKGSVKLYQHFLNKTESSKSFPKGVKQMHEFNYYKNIDWNITDDLKLNYFESTQFTSYFIRKEKSIYYYNNKENDFFPLLHKLIKSF